MEDRTGRDGEAGSWGRYQTPAAAKAYYLRVIKPALGSGSIRSQQELHTLATALDHCAQGRFREAADVLAARLTAVEFASSAGNWDRAKYMEIVEPDGLTLAGRETQLMATREAERAARLNRTKDTNSKDKDKNSWQNWQSSSKGTGKNNPKGGKAAPWDQWNPANQWGNTWGNPWGNPWGQDGKKGGKDGKDGKGKGKDGKDGKYKGQWGG